MTHTLTRFIRTSPFFSLLILLFVILLGVCTWAANGPNFEISWDRSVPSAHTPEELGAALDDVGTWPVFHHSLKSASLITEKGTPVEQTQPAENTLTVGKTIHYEIEPMTKQWKRFDLFGKITEHVNGKKLAVELTRDSTGRLTKIFDEYRWNVEIEPASEMLQAKGFKSVIHGNAIAHTASWKGRMFGTITPRILMNQIFYVDLVKFGTLAKQIEAKKENLAPSYQ